MRSKLLKELLEDPAYECLSVKEFVKELKDSGVWDFDVREEAIELLKKELEELK